VVFAYLNTNKRSIVVDAGGTELLHSIIASADRDRRSPLLLG